MRLTAIVGYYKLKHYILQIEEALSKNQIISAKYSQIVAAKKDGLEQITREYN